MDLRQLVWGESPIGCRRLLSLIMGIPPHTSALARKRLGDAATWDAKTELQATTVDTLNAIARIVAAIGGAKPDTDFEPYPRPFELPEREPEKTVSLAEFADFLKGP